MVLFDENNKKYNGYWFETYINGDKFVSINSFQRENGEFITYYEKPLNVYRDLKAPNLKITNIPKEWANAKDQGKFSFNFTLDDKEEVPADASDEVKRIYNDIINFPTENLTEIKSVTIGDYCFTNNNGVWEKNCLVQGNSDDSEEEPAMPLYDVDLIPPDEYYTGEFTAKVYLSDEAKRNGVTGLKNDITVTAEDICGNTVKNSDGSLYSVPVKIDIDAPEITKLKAENIGIYPDNSNFDIAVVQGSGKFALAAEGKDKTSELKNISVVYLDENKNIITDFVKKNGMYYPSDADLANGSGYIRIQLTDNAGNQSVYYYSDTNSENETDFNSYFSEATQVLFDSVPPVTEIEAENAVPFDFSKAAAGAGSGGALMCFKTNGSVWYDQYPEFTVKAFEPDKGVKSGVRKIFFRIGAEEETVDVRKAGIPEQELKSGCKLVLEADEKDGSVFRPVLRWDGGEYYIYGEKKLSLGSNGKLEINIYSADAASNRSANASAEGNIDNTKPDSDGKFSASAAGANAVSSLSFGTFSNDRIKISVRTGDKGNSSGISGAVLTFAGRRYLCTGDMITGGYASFIVPEKELPENGSVSDNEIVIDIYDNVGNRSEYRKLLSDKGSPSVVIEKNRPEVKGPFIVRQDTGTAYFFSTKAETQLDFENYFDTYDSGIYNESNDVFSTRFEDGDNIWYGNDITVSFEISDDREDDSGLSLLSSSEHRDDKYGIFESISENTDKDFTAGSDNEAVKEKITEYIQKFSTVPERDGRYDFSVDITDNAGNRSDGKSTVFIDNTKPRITRIEYSCADGSTSSEDGVNQKVAAEGSDLINFVSVFSAEYSYFFNKPAKARVYASDVSDISISGSDKTESSSCGIREIRAYIAEDDGATCRRLEMTGDIQKDENGYYADFALPENFKGTVFAAAIDNVTNISDISGTRGVITENMDKHLGFHNGIPVSVIGVRLPETQYTDIDGNPLYNAPITAELDISDIFSGIKTGDIRLSENGQETVYKTEIRRTDEEHIFSTGDWDAVSMDRNLYSLIKRKLYIDRNVNNSRFVLGMSDMCGNISSGEEKIFSIDTTAPVITAEYSGAAADSVFSNVYNGDRTVKININERNFDPELVTAEGIDGLSDWTLTSGTRGNDDAVYSATAVFSNDGSYSFKVGFHDRCDNEAEEYQSDEFIIDKTAPVLSVAFDNDSYESGNYYSASRTAVITVTEENFDPERIRINAYDKISENNIPEITGWIHTGNNIHQAQIRFMNDGEYELNISGSDKAGNAMDPYSESFIIDTVKPEIRITGVKRANKGKVSPVVSFTDSYLRSDSVRMTLSGAKNGNDLELNGEYRTVSGGFVFNFDDFEKTKENDDVYTLTAYAEDKAGNQYSDQIVFSVNRFGSNFIFDKDTEALKGRYVSWEPEVTVYEINADEHDEEPMILITHDLDTDQAVEAKNYSVSLTGGDDDWYEYKYTLFSGNFSEDGAYAVELYTHDSAGNSNNSVSEEKDAELRFGVDKTPPICTALDFESGGSYKSEVKSAHVLIDDNIIPKDIDVYLDDEKVKTTLTDERVYEFKIPASSQPHTVKLVVYDMADNSREYIFDRVFVSTNIAMVLLHKTWFRISVAAAAAASFGLVSFLKKRRYKKILSGEL